MTEFIDSTSLKIPAVQDGVDARLLRSKKWPELGEGRTLRVVDLFAGVGGMSAGSYLAAAELGRGFEIALAAEINPGVREIYRKNFEDCLGDEARIVEGPLENEFAGSPGARLSDHQERLREACGDVSILMGGPPCQGNSDLNNHTRRNDTRNDLYLRMVRAAAVLEPDVVVIENVPPVVHDRGRIVDSAERALNRLEYATVHVSLAFDRLGVPQRRRRHILIAARGATNAMLLDLASGLEAGWAVPVRDVRWAIGNLKDRSQPAEVKSFDSPTVPSKDNRARLNWFDKHPDEWVLPDEVRPDCHRTKIHSYKSVYGRMRWTEPANTVTTGYGSMGQGCYVHPGSPARTITPHEAARLQTFPDCFDFEAGSAKRTTWARGIGNAVPPLGMREVVKSIMALSLT